MEDEIAWWNKAVECGWLVDTKQSRARARSEVVLDSAKQSFNSRGYEKTRIEQIAATANCSVGSIYQRFPDKKSILCVLQLRQYYSNERGLDRLSEVHASRLTTDDILYRYIIRTAEHMRTHTKIRRAFIDFSITDKAALSVKEHHAAYMGDRLTDFLVNRREIEDSAISRVQGMMISKIVMGTLDNLFADTAADTDSINVVLTLRDMILAYIRQKRL